MTVNAINFGFFFNKIRNEKVRPALVLMSVCTHIIIHEQVHLETPRTPSSIIYGHCISQNCIPFLNARQLLKATRYHDEFFFFFFFINFLFCVLKNWNGKLTWLNLVMSAQKIFVSKYYIN